MAGEQEEKRGKIFLEGEKKKFKKPEDKPIEKIPTIGINEGMLKRAKDKNSNSKTNNNLNFDQDFGDAPKDSQKNPSETASSPATVTSTLAQAEKKNQTSKEIQKHSNSTRPIPQPRENSNQARPVAQSAPPDKWTQWYKTIAQQARQENPELKDKEKLREKIQELVSRSISNSPKNKTYTDDQIQEFVGQIMQSVPPVIQPKPKPPLPPQDRKPKLSSTQSVEKPNSEGKKEQVVTDSTGQQVNKQQHQTQLSLGAKWNEYIKNAIAEIENQKLDSNQQKLEAIFQDTASHLKDSQYSPELKNFVISTIAAGMEIEKSETQVFLKEKAKPPVPDRSYKKSFDTKPQSPLEQEKQITPTTITTKDEPVQKPVSNTETTTNSPEKQDTQKSKTSKGRGTKEFIQNILKGMPSISLPKFGRRSSAKSSLNEVTSEATLSPDPPAPKEHQSNNPKREAKNTGEQKSKRSLPKAVLNQAVGLFKKIAGHGTKEAESKEGLDTTAQQTQANLAGEMQKTGFTNTLKPVQGQSRR